VKHNPEILLETALNFMAVKIFPLRTILQALEYRLLVLKIQALALRGHLGLVHHQLWIGLGFDHRRNFRGYEGYAYTFSLCAGLL